MKRKDLIKLLESNGFVFDSHGGNHDKYVRGTDFEMIPRHSEIMELLAKKIIKRNGLK